MFKPPRGWETILRALFGPCPTAAALAGVCVDHQPIFLISSLSSKELGAFALHLKCGKCGLAT